MEIIIKKQKFVFQNDSFINLDHHSYDLTIQEPGFEEKSQQLFVACIDDEAIVLPYWLYRFLDAKKKASAKLFYDLNHRKKLIIFY